MTARLYPRKPGPSRDEDVRAKARAHRELDRARRGGCVQPDVVEWALRLTGDSTLTKPDLETS